MAARTAPDGGAGSLAGRLDGWGLARRPVSLGSVPGVGVVIVVAAGGAGWPPIILSMGMPPVRANQNPRPFAWTKTAEEILDSLAKYIAKISGAAY